MNQDLTTAMILMRDHDEYRRLKSAAFAALKGRREISDREQWESHKWIRLEIGTRMAIYGMAEKLISNQQLYADLAL